MQKIVIISSFSERTPATFLKEAYVQLGHKVISIGSGPAKYVDIQRSGGFSLKPILKTLGIDPDLCIFVEGGEMDVFPVDISELPGVKVWWGIDTPYAPGKHRNINRLFDIAFLAQMNYVEQFIKEGQINVRWLPLAFPDYAHLSQSTERSIDIAYVGTLDRRSYSNRARLLDLVRDSVANTVVETQTPDEMLKTYSKAKLVFNFSLADDLNMRYFEAIGCGAILVTNRIANPGVEQIFKLNKNIFFYETDQELIATIESLLDNPSFISKQARLNSQLVAEKHLYTHRADEILEIASAKVTKAVVQTSNYLPAIIDMNFFSMSLMLFRKSLYESRRGSFSRIQFFFLNPLLLLSISVAKSLEVLRRNFHGKR